MRSAHITRNTSETRITVDLTLNGTGELDINCGVPFLEHMLDQVVHHGMLNLRLQAKGDVQVDDHHTVEDIGIALGQAFAAALGDKRGIQRYGHAYVPLDEALSRVVIDFSGRPGLYMDARFSREYVGRFDTQLCFEFFQGFVNHAGATLHIDNLKGTNAHHQLETIFKAFGRAVRQAIAIDPVREGLVASTKGTLTG